VLYTLELLEDLDKQMVSLANDALKAQKKQAKKEQIEREELLREKLKEVRRIQSLLNSFQNDTIRSDFLNELNGASVSTSICTYNLKYLYYPFFLIKKN
jgi:hypothetical protein